VQRRNLVKADDDILDGFRLDEVSDSRVTAGAERLMLGIVEDLVDESLQYEMELVISNLGDWLTQVRWCNETLGVTYNKVIAHGGRIWLHEQTQPSTLNKGQ